MSQGCFRWSQGHFRGSQGLRGFQGGLEEVPGGLKEIPGRHCGVAEVFRVRRSQSHFIKFQRISWAFQGFSEGLRKISRGLIGALEGQGASDCQKFSLRNSSTDSY